MTLIITALAAVVTTALYLRLPSGRTNGLGTLALAYFSASLMWTVDGIASLIAGEPFVELSDAAVVADDTLLGFTIVLAGLLVWGASLLVRGRLAKRA